MRSARTFVAAIVCGLGLSSAAFAQGTGDLVGRVTDASGGVMPGATVTAENQATHDTRVATTSGSGDYVFTLLPIGTYSVKIELQGFTTQTARVVLATGDRARVDVRLQIGAIAETVTVAGESPLVQTDSSTVSTLFDLKKVQDLPIAGRNVIRLVQMIPGANEGAVSSLANGTRPDDRRQTSAVSINGSADNQNNQLVDGLDNNERAIGTVGIKPSIDAIAEVKVQTNLYSADVGRTAGGVVNIITKSGGNDFHGSAFEFLRNDRFDAKDFFARTKPTLEQNQYGGSFGGPIRTNKTFFFVDYEGFRSTQGVANLITVPTMKMRSGDFSELPVVIYDPTAFPRVPFSGNMIPVNRLDPTAQRLIALYPAPNAPGLANNYSSVTDRTQNYDTTDVRIDHRFDSKSSIFARYSYNKVYTFTPGACPIVNDIDPNCIVGGIAAGGAFPGPNNTTAHNAVVSFVRVFSPTLISEVKGGYVRPDIRSLPANYQKYLGTQFGIPNTNFDDSTSGMPLMSTTGYALIGDAQAVPLITRDSSYQFAVAFTKTSRAHNIKVGGGAILREFSVTQSISPVGVFTFDSLLTAGPGNVGGNTIASFLLGYPSQVVRAHNPFEPKYHTNEPSVYVQDDWRATSWLTLNLGVRYDVFTPLTEESNTLANFDPATGTILAAGQNGVSRTAGINADYSNIAPRLGFAATLPSGTVLRGGYGLSYFPGNMTSFAYLKNPPFTANYGPVISLGSSGGLPNVKLSDGLPPLANNSAVNLSGAIIATDPDFQATRVQQFNVTLEKEFAGNVVSGSYVGSRGDRVAANPNINLAPVGPGPIPQRRALAALQPALSNVNFLQSVYETHYDAMQLVFQRRYHDGLSFNTHYTLGHATASAAAPWDYTVVEWGDAPLDIRHRWVVTLNYELPWAKSATGLTGLALANWQVNIGAFYQTGIPFNVTNAASRTNTGGADRPNLVGDPELPENEQTLTKWFDTSAFVAQTQNTAGNAPLNVLHGPSAHQINFSLFKNFDLGSSRRLQFRWEVYNATNVANFVNPNSALGNPAFGTISSTGNNIPRQMQFGLKFLF